MGLKTARLEDLTTVMSHTHALGQCRRRIREMNLKSQVAADTAGAARIVAEEGDLSLAAIASELAAEIYGLKVFRSNMEDAAHNTTRFVILSREAREAGPSEGPVITSLVFRVRNVPAALYKALGGFATNGINMTKLESYQLGGSFSATQFFADIEGHPQSRSVALALEELGFFTSELRVLGVYSADPFRSEPAAR
jgi:prephenate dehydratase